MANCNPVTGFLDNKGNFHETCEEANIHSIAEEIRMLHNKKGGSYSFLTKEQAVDIVRNVTSRII